MFRKLRILILLLVLVGVAMNTWLGHLRATDWNSPLWVVIYPINGDGSASAAATIAELTSDDFSEIDDWFVTQGKRFGRELRSPLIIKLGPVVPELPPAPPVGGGPFAIGFWSLHFRYWAATHDQFNGPPPNIRMFVLYHAPVGNRPLDNSLGLEKGQLGVVNAFATPAMRGRNNIVIAHELLHTLGATDRYDLNTDQPLFPDGYAEPDRKPLYPQPLAEIMAGRAPLSQTESEMPEHLAGTFVGARTAREIRWIE